MPLGTAGAISRILCPVDFSDQSDHAVDQALAVARWYGARVTGLHVYSPAFMPVPGLPAPDRRVPDEELARVQALVAARFHAAAGAHVPVDVIVEIGDPVTVILDRAVRWSADLIVMGTHGASGFEHLVLGSVTEKVLRKAPCAVLTVPPRAPAASKLPFERILCAVDFSEASLAAAARAFSLAQETQAALTLAHVIEWPWHEPPAPAAEQLPAAQAAALAEYRRYLGTMATTRLERLVPDDFRGRCDLRLRHGKSHVEILRIAVEEAADVIVLGVHGRSAFDLALFGSTANQVVRGATCPVLTVRPLDEKRTKERRDG